MATTLGIIGPFIQGHEDWVSYAERLQEYFTANDIDSDVKQRAVLLSACGADVYQLVRNLVAPQKPSTKTFDQIVELVQNHFCPPPSAIAQRFAFNNRVQREGETMAQFVAELRKLSQHCEFEGTLEQMIRDRIVCGIRDSRLQRRLLAETGLTFKKAFELCQTCEVAEKNAKELQTGQKQSCQMAGASVMAMHSTSSSKKERSTWKCYRCNSEQHLAKDCCFKTATCHACGKIGHIAKACRSKGKAHGNQQENKKSFHRPAKRAHQLSAENRQDCKLDALYKVQETKETPFCVTAVVDKAEVIMEVDTGASISVMSEKTFKDTWRGSGPKLQSSHIQVKTYTGETLNILGFIDTEVEYEGQKAFLPLQIIAGNGPTLLGRDWLKQLKLNWHAICQLSDSVTLDSVLDSYSSVFSGKLGCVQGMSAKIQVEPGSTPRFCKARTVPYALRGRVERELDRLQEVGVIEPVEFAEWAAPIVPVVKRDGSIRICGDFKVTVNKIAKVDTYPLPRIEDLFASLSGGKLFSKIDLAHAYQQILLGEDSKKFVVINTQKGLYRYNRLPFGIASAPAIFQRMMEGILQGVPHVTVYIDDILVTGTSDWEHLQNLQEVLMRLEKAGLKLKREKCAFMLPSVEYLGHVISKEGLKPTNEKVRAIVKAPAPKDVTQLRSFLGLVNYYAKFLPSLSSVLAPLNQLLQKSQEWMWGLAQAKAFQTAKEALTSATVLTHYNPDLDLVLECDASPYGVGAVLSHKWEDGSTRPIAFASRSLNPAERNYAHLDKEGLAIVFGVKKFHQFLFGRKFTINSDHKPLRYIFDEAKSIPAMASARLQRWALLLSAYDYVIEYKPGTLNGNADLLSRLPLPEAPKEVPIPGETVLSLETLQISPITAKQIKTWTSRDPVLSKVVERALSGWSYTTDDTLAPYQRRKDELSLEEGCVMWGNRVVVPEVGRQRVLQELHVGHPGISKMKSLARGVAWWPGMDADIENQAQTCTECQENQKSPAVASLHPWEWPANPWERLHIDYAGPFLGKMFLVVVDAHSKWLEVEVVSAATSTQTIAKLRSMFATHGLPQLVVSDNGSVFTSLEFKEFMERNGIRHVKSAPYHPASNGLAERYVQTFKRSLRKAGEGADVQTQLSRFLLRYRTTPHSTTGVPPAQLLMGRRLQTQLDLIRPSIASRVSRAQAHQKVGHDKSSHDRQFTLGEAVFVRNFTAGPRWVAGVITTERGPRSFDVELSDARVIRRHIDHIRKRKEGTQVEDSTRVDNEDVPLSSTPEIEKDQGPTIPQVTVPRRSNRVRRPPDRYTS